MRASIVLVFGLAACAGEPGPPGPPGSAPASAEVASALAADPEFVAACAAALASTEIGDRVEALEDRHAGIGYIGMLHRWGGAFLDPTVKCNGPESDPRNFAASPARFRIATGWRGRRPQHARISVRRKNGSGGPEDDLAFDQLVPLDDDDYRFEVPFSCEETYSVGIGTTAPSRE